MDNSRFIRNDNLAPFFDSSKQKKIETQRSAFDYGRSHSFQLKFGMLSVADCFPTLPNSNYKLSCNLNAIFRNPTVRKLINNCRIFVEYFYCREGDLWEGSHNTVTKGRSGNIQKEYPSLRFQFVPDFPESGSGDVSGTFFTYDTPDSLMDDFGLPCIFRHDYENDGDSSPINSFMPIIGNSANDFDNKSVSHGVENNSNLFINALPFFMYQKVWRDYYLNKNLSYGNKNILPDNEEHFIIPYEQDSIFYLNYDMPSGDNQVQSLLTSDMATKLSDVNMTDSQTPLMLAQKRFRQYRGDYFTTAFPFPEGIRGDIPVLDLTSDVSDLSINIPGLNLKAIPQGGPSNGPQFLSLRKSGTELDDGNVLYNVVGQDTGITNNGFTTAGQRANFESGTTISTSITLNDIRQLEAFTKFQERMARTDGDYSEMITAQFGSNTVKTSRKPIYIGGFYQDILVNSVYQTSQSTSDSPLGRQSGIGVSTGEHYVGDFYSDDYGYIMAVISCVPEVYYVNGIDRMFSVRSQSDKYFPLMNELPPQPILNKELFVSGNENLDNDVFAYAERFSEFKSRRNLITGKGRFFASSDIGMVPIDEYDSARAIMRQFEETPNFNNDFVQATDVDMSPFSVRDEMPLDIDFGSKVTAVLPMPYITLPGGADEN